MKTRKCYETHTQCHGSECEQTKPERAQDAQHTPGPASPTPWHLNTLENPMFSIHSLRGHVADVSRGTMLELSFDEREANAAFIVRACNAHEELLNALEIAEATLDRIAPDGSRATQGTRDVIRAALAKAKGRK